VVERFAFALERFASPRHGSHVAQLFSLGRQCLHQPHRSSGSSRETLYSVAYLSPDCGLLHGVVRLGSSSLSMTWQQTAALDYRRAISTSHAGFVWAEASLLFSGSSSFLASFFFFRLFGSTCERRVGLTHHWSQPALALSVPLRGQSRRSPVAQFSVVGQHSHDEQIRMSSRAC